MRKEIRIAIHSDSVSGLLMLPSDARACFVFAHGAGAGMTHPFMDNFAGGLFARGVATLRYQFPSMQKGSKRPDSPAVAQATVRVAVAAAAQHCGALPLVAGGKSFGGRMTSQAQASEPLAGVRGLVFVGFPLHPAGKPSELRSEHLDDIRIPMLFLQGSRDGLAQLDLIQHVTKRLGTYATLRVFEQADHSFHVPVRSGRTDAQVMGKMCDGLAAWIDGLVPVNVG
jgi:uncharacterized protein